MTTSLTELLGRISAGWGKKISQEDRDERPSWSSIRQAMDIPTRREMAHRHMLQKTSEWIKSAGQGMSVIDLGKVADIIDTYDAGMRFREVQAEMQEVISTAKQKGPKSIKSVLLQENDITRTDAMGQFTQALVDYQRLAEESTKKVDAQGLFKEFQKKTDWIVMRCVLSGVAFPSKYLQLTPELFETILLCVGATSPITEEELKEVIVLLGMPGASVTWEVKGFNSFSLAMTIRTQVVQGIEFMRNQVRGAAWPTVMVAHNKLLANVKRARKRHRHGMMLLSEYKKSLDCLGYENNAESVNAMCQAVTLGFLAHGIMPARGLFLLTRQGVDYLRRCGIIEEATDDDND